MSDGILLRGLDGSNPLAFLAALGTLRTLTLALPDERVRMSWEQHDGAWRPRVHSTIASSDDIAAAIVDTLNDSTQSLGDPAEESRLKKLVVTTKKALKDATEKLKERRLRGADLEAARRVEIEPLKQRYEDAKSRWLAALATSVPSLELSLGRDLSASPTHFRSVALRAVSAPQIDRLASDLLAVFGCEACFDRKGDRLHTTPFCFITGSGHQYFLDTAKALLTCVDKPRVVAALFKDMPFADEKLSMRWSPIEDRRYACMWADPTSAGNEPLTSWALNLLAYRGLSLVQAAPVAHGFATAGFIDGAWHWPIWQRAICCDVVRSLLADPDVRSDRSYRAARGVVECFCSERLVVGKPPLHKINFSPARPV